MGSVMRQVGKVKDIMMMEEVDLREINRNILESIERLMEMDEKGVFVE